MNTSRRLALQTPKNKPINYIPGIKWLAWSKTKGIVSRSLYRGLEHPHLCQLCFLPSGSSLVLSRVRRDIAVGVPGSRASLLLYFALLRRFAWPVHLILAYSPGAWPSVQRVNALTRVAYHSCVRLPRPNYTGTTHYYLSTNSCTRLLIYVLPHRFNLLPSINPRQRSLMASMSGWFPCSCIARAW